MLKSQVAIVFAAVREDNKGNLQNRKTSPKCQRNGPGASPLFTAPAERAGLLLLLQTL